MGGKGGAPHILREDLEKCGFDVKDEYEIYYVPTADELERCYEMGRKLVKG